MTRSTDPKERNDGVERRRLHDAVDRIMDGPGSSTDEWVVQVLADLGALVQAASPALYFETGRVITGVGRPRGNFLVGTNGPRWRGASLNRKTNKWMVIGENALDETQPVELVQRVLAAVLHPIARVSHHPWLIGLAEAMRAASLGQDHPFLKLSLKGLHGYRQGMRAWQLRLRALAWAERRRWAGFEKKSDALSKVASTFEVHEDTLKRWKREAQEILGREEVSWKLSEARNLGKFYRATKEQIADGDPPASETVRYLNELEKVFNESWLQMLAREFKALPRQRKMRSA